MQNIDFNDRHVVITGGAGALGSAVVRRLIDAGATCWVPCFNQDELDAFELASHERVHTAVDVDLTDESACDAFFSKPPSLWASIHIAGGFAMGGVRDTGADDWRRMMDMNATSCFLSCREAVKRMTGGGRIVNVAAKPALEPAGGMIPYSASKAAVASITQSLAEEVKADGIWVNAIVPSILDTPANREAMPKADHDAWPSVDDVAATVVFLASPQNAVTRGALVPVYGKS
jgi:NAD(P)-dependent dehydrogenase (short-subunit alcohol dehydrogenase family)